MRLGYAHQGEGLYSLEQSYFHEVESFFAQYR